MKIYTLIIIQVMCISLFAQNKLDDKGKRTGKWLIYLDNNWKEINDSNIATYKVYDIYVDGKQRYSFLGKHKFKYRLECEQDKNNKFLNGEYKWFDKKNNIIDVFTFKNGEITSRKNYLKNGILSFHDDYSITYKNYPFSFGVYYFDKLTNQNVLYMYRNGDKGWTLYECDLKDPNLIRNTH